MHDLIEGFSHDDHADSDDWEQGIEPRFERHIHFACRVCRNQQIQLKPEVVGRIALEWCQHDVRFPDVGVHLPQGVYELVGSIGKRRTLNQRHRGQLYVVYKRWEIVYVIRNSVGLLSLPSEALNRMSSVLLRLETAPSGKILAWKQGNGLGSVAGLRGDCFAFAVSLRVLKVGALL